ncbi:MAG: CYTH domain-containing protein [Chloroflexi bacterium]|nr:CYTH domain-containing protein [Chloroflexota bacterium]
MTNQALCKKLEVEAKFAIPDARTARVLQLVARIGEFTLDPAETLRVRDTFYDTRTRALRGARNVLRVRQRSDGRTLVALKAPTKQRGAIHRRPETEVAVNFERAPRKLSRENLPPRLDKLLAPMCNDASLHPLFATMQTRHIRAVRQGRRVIGEWSVDRVEFRAGTRRQVFYELEIELKKSGTEVELAELVEALRQSWKLKPQARGKFQRAQEFMSHNE